MIGIVIVRTTGVVRLLPLTVNEAVTLEAANEGVIVIVDADPVVGVAPVIVHAYVGLVTFCTTAVNTDDAGVMTVPAAFLLNPVKPDISTKGPTGATGFHTNAALIGLSVELVTSLPTLYAK